MKATWNDEPKEEPKNPLFPLKREDIKDKHPLMKCGHTAQGKDRFGNPVCAICVGLMTEAREVDPSPPDISGRMARCPDCHTEVKSDFSLPFFSHRPNSLKDAYYCGCRGWD